MRIRFGYPKAHRWIPTVSCYIKSYVSIQWITVERGRRIELLASVWKTEVLPLYEPRIMTYLLALITYIINVLPSNVLTCLPTLTVDTVHPKLTSVVVIHNRLG